MSQHNLSTRREPVRSMLHMLLGQETVYLLLTISVFAAMVLAAYVVRQRASTDEPQKPYEEPPIVTLAEADGFYFEPGSAEVSPQFRAQLRDKVVPRVKAISAKYDARIVEIVGHTDEVPLSSQRRSGSNLDRSLVPWLSQQNGTVPIAYDNVGLGMARAVSVARELRAADIGSDLAIEPLSAGPLVKPGDVITDGTTSGADVNRRRIEIRVRRRAGLQAPP